MLKVVDVADRISSQSIPGDTHIGRETNDLLLIYDEFLFKASAFLRLRVLRRIVDPNGHAVQIFLISIVREHLSVLESEQFRQVCLHVTDDLAESPVLDEADHKLYDPLLHLLLVLARYRIREYLHSRLGKDGNDLAHGEIVVCPDVSSAWSESWSSVQVFPLSRLHQMH